MEEGVVAGVVQKVRCTVVRVHSFAGLHDLLCQDVPVTRVFAGNERVCDLIASARISGERRTGKQHTPKGMVGEHVGVIICQTSTTRGRTVERPTVCGTDLACIGKSIGEGKSAFWIENCAARQH